MNHKIGGNAMFLYLYRFSTVLSVIVVCSLFDPFIHTGSARQTKHVAAYPVPFSLSYIESSQGLMPFKWDGGRTELEMGDVDGDGNPDIVSIGDHGSPYINTQEHGIMVWFGDGNGVWSDYQNGNFGYGGICLGDVNNDGLMDAGYGMHHNYSSDDFGDQLLEVALGDGSGRNWEPWDDGLGTNGETWGMFCTDFADVNNDGLLDIGSNSFGSGAGVHVYVNQGDGSWEQSWGILGGNSNMDFCFGDVNSDGNADFAVAHQHGTVYLGDGSGNFTLADGNLPDPGFISLGGPSLGDINNDGYQDVAFTKEGGVQVWAWAGNDTWVNASGMLPSSGEYEITQLCDMNVDGYVDVAAFGERHLTVWTGDGAGGWTEEITFETPKDPGDCAAFRAGTDADHNGYPDIVVCCEEGGWLNATNVLHFYREAHAARTLRVKLLHPRTGETFTRGSVRFIDWAAAVPDGEETLVMLELSTSGPEGPWMTVADDLPNNGRYQCTVNAREASNNCFMRITLKTGQEEVTDVNTSAFSIID
jgi:hypothetical protein